MDAKKFEDYLVNAISEKERERTQLDGELSALNCTLATFRQMGKEQSQPKNRFRVRDLVVIKSTGITTEVVDIEYYDNEWHYNLKGVGLVTEKELK